MKILTGAIDTQFDEILLDFIEKYRFCRPGISLFLLLEVLPCDFRFGMLFKNRVFRLLAEKHSAGNGANLPDTARFAKKDSIAGAVGLFEGVQDIDYPVGPGH